jgi:triacylglycerol esterase/lipase EstA (alpha/beta hydrolase family)
VGTKVFFRAALAALLATALFATTSGGAGAAPTVASASSVAAASPVDGTDWSCRPSAAHPNPVVMLHGLTGTSEANWTYLAPQLVANGYCVFTLTYGQVSPDADIGGMGPIDQSARQVADFIGRVRSATGAARVDIVGHSEGGFIGLYIPKVLGLSSVVGRVVALAPPTHGTTVSGLTTFADFFGVRPLLDEVLRQFGCDACADALPGSATVRAITTGAIARPGVAYTIVATRYDAIVTPTATAFVSEPGVRNVYVQDVCPYDTVGHIGLALDQSVLGIVLNALDPAHQRPVNCWFGPPI